MSILPLKYKDRRVEGETILRQCQLVQLHLLYVVDAICRKHGLEYCLDGGSLIGAMRHNGFIPWDDDLDIGLLRRDYKRFLKIAAKELPADVILQTPQTTPERVFGFSKLHDAYSFYAERSRGVSMTHPNGIFIDVFPYDKVPSLPGGLDRPLVRLCQWAHHYGRALRVSGGRGWSCALFAGWLALLFYALHFTLRFLIWSLVPFFPTNVYYGLTTLFTFSYRLDALIPLQRHVFEDGEFPVPANPDVVLASQYGDWRKLPPESQRQGAHGKLILPFQSINVPGSMKWDEK